MKLFNPSFSISFSLKTLSSSDIPFLLIIIQKLIHRIHHNDLLPDELINLNIHILIQQFSQIIVTPHLEPVLSGLFPRLRSLHLYDLLPSNFYSLILHLPGGNTRLILLFFPHYSSNTFGQYSLIIIIHLSKYFLVLSKL